MAEIRAGGEVMNKRPLSAASSLSECSPPNGILKSPASLSFRGAEGDEESRTRLQTLRARFLAPFGMTMGRPSDGLVGVAACWSSRF